MTSATLTALLSNLGWGSGFRLPVANDENRALETLLEEKQKELLRLNAILESDTQHCQVLKNHLERVTKTVTQSQKMVSAKKTGIETENNILSIAERVLSRSKYELKTTIETIHDYEDRNLRMANDVETRRRNVEELVSTVKFDRAALERYKEVAQEKENDIEYLTTLNKLDERTAENFQLKFAKAGEDLSTARRILHETAMNTQSLQQRFNRLCAQFRRLHVERGQAVSFWEGTLRSMQQRDDDIREVAEEYADIRVALQQVDSQCDRNRRMLEAEKHSTGNLEYQLASSDKTCVNYRMRLAEGKDMSLQFRDEVLAYNTIINQTSRMVKDIQTKIQNHENELAVMQQKLEKAGAELMEAKERFDMAVMDTMSEEAKAREYEKMIEQEELRMEGIIQDVEKQRRYLWQRSNDMAAMEQKIKSVMTQIKGTKAMIIALRDRAKNDDIMIQKRRQQAYHLELECVGLEARIQNVISAEIDVAQAASTTRTDLPKLREKIAEITKTKAFLAAQEAHLVQVNKRIVREIQAVKAEHAQLQLYIETEKMEAKRCTIDTQKAIQDLQNAKIDYRMLELNLKRLLRWAQEERDKLVSLEQERLLMDAVAKERKSEIAMHMGLLKAQQKHLKEERNRLALNIAELESEIERSKTRYEYIINAMNLYGDDAGYSESYYILKHAQEKETLKREGDLWDAKVKETEKEIAALQNTLSVIVSSNMAFKESLAPAAADTPEAKMVAELEDEYRHVLIRKRKAEKAQKEIYQRFQNIATDMAECKQSRICLEGMVAEKKYELNNVHYEIANQKSKIARASRLASRLVKELGLHIHEDRELIEADLKLRCAREKLEFALKTLEKSLFLHGELRETTVAFLEKTDLDSLTSRIRKRIRQKEGIESPYYSGQVTPIRYLTPVSTTNLGHFVHSKQVPPPSEVSSKPTTPPGSLASKPGSASSKSRSVMSKSSKQQELPSKPEPDAEKISEKTEKYVSMEPEKEARQAETTMLFKSERHEGSRSEVFEAERSTSTIGTEEGEAEQRTTGGSVRTSAGTEYEDRPSFGSQASSKPAEAQDDELPQAGGPNEADE